MKYSPIQLISLTILGFSICILSCKKEKPELPVVTTASVTKNTDASAVSGGNVTSEGGAPITAKGVCWNSAPNPSLTNSFTAESGGAGEPIRKVSLKR